MLLRLTRSVCPVCLQNIEAKLVESGDLVFMHKSCPEHGEFSVPVWRGLENFGLWRGEAPPLGPDEGGNCPQNCGICSAHGRGSCCVLLEVTRRCNLRCRFCFAHSAASEPELEELKKAVDNIILRAGKVLIQLSGGEPSLRDDLPELVRYIKSRGAAYVQINTNGLRLARDEEYVKALAEAGLDIVFLQFDGCDDRVYESLRGRTLFEEKKRAIELCSRYGLGVTLVSTLVRGINDAMVGEIVRFGASLSPAVRGVHFQPVSYFGHYPGAPKNTERYTLDELIHALQTQAGIKGENIAPSRCDHPACGLHAAFVVTPEGALQPLTCRDSLSALKSTSAHKNREFIGSRWSRNVSAEKQDFSGNMEDMDAFVSRVKSHSFTVSAMAFQDAMNLDIERLRRCSLHVWSEGKLKPFCSAYLTAMEGV